MYRRLWMATNNQILSEYYIFGNEYSKSQKYKIYRAVERVNLFPRSEYTLLYCYQNLISSSGFLFFRKAYKQDNKRIYLHPQRVIET